MRDGISCVPTVCPPSSRATASRAGWAECPPRRWTLGTVLRSPAPHDVEALPRGVLRILQQVGRVAAGWGVVVPVIAGHDRVVRHRREGVRGGGPEQEI